jgi:hypothetical protein
VSGGARSAAHKELVRAILMDLGAGPGWRIWENEGDVAHPRWAPNTLKRFGGPKGSADISGVAAPFGCRVELEVKTGKAQPEADQRNFLAMVNRHGGVGRVVRSVEDARAALLEAQRPPEARAAFAEASQA